MKVLEEIVAYLHHRGALTITGMIRSFCNSVGVRDVHLLQCDTGVSRDEVLDVDTFATLTISGFGGSDLSPALRRLADDPEVLAVVVLTDGYIDYPEEQMPYEILWALTIQNARFDPPYGRVLPLAP